MGPMTPKPDMAGGSLLADAILYQQAGVKTSIPPQMVAMWEDARDRGDVEAQTRIEIAAYVLATRASAPASSAVVREAFELQIERERAENAEAANRTLQHTVNDQAARLVALRAQVEQLTKERDSAYAQVDRFSECASIMCPYEKRMRDAEAEVARLTAERDALVKGGFAGDAVFDDVLHGMYLSEKTKVKVLTAERDMARDVQHEAEQDEHKQWERAEALQGTLDALVRGGYVQHKEGLCELADWPYKHSPESAGLTCTCNLATLLASAGRD